MGSLNTIFKPLEVTLSKSASILFLFVFVFMAFAGTAAQSISATSEVQMQGVSFDPAPLELADVPPSEPHLMTPMDLLTMRNFYGVQISPDGKSVAFVVGEAVYDTNSYRSGLFVIDTAPGSLPRRLGSAGPPRWDLTGQWMPEPPKWSPDNRYIAYRLKTNGTWQMWRWDRDGRNALQLTHTDSDVVDFSWSKDGKEITFDVKKLPLPQTIQTIEEKGMLYQALSPVFENKSIMQQEIEQLPNETEAWSFNLDSGQERKLSREEQDQREQWKLRLGDKIVDEGKWASGGDHGNIIDPELSPDGSRAIFRTWNGESVAGHATFPLYIKKLGGGPPLAVNPEVSVGSSSYWWSADAKHIYFSGSFGDGHSEYLYVVSADGGQPISLFPDHKAAGYFDNFSVDDSGSLAAATLENNTIPPRIALIDLRNGTVRTLVDINPQFTNIRFSDATRIDWVTKYGQPGRGYLVKPLNYKPGQRYPLIVTTYYSGDYFLRGGGGEEYPIQVFAANGFAVLAWDHGPYPDDPIDGNFEQGMLRYKWPVAGLEAALAAVDKLGIVDQQRCGITGFSYGTEIADYVVSHHPELFSTAITSGMSGRDPYFYYMAPRFWKEVFRNWGLELPTEKSTARWREYSTSLNADHIRAPLLSNASEDDFMSVFQLYTTLEQLGKPVELFIYPNELHFKVQPKHLYEIYQRNLDWFKFWLQDIEDPDEAKKAQYERWHRLRALHEKDLATIN